MQVAQVSKLNRVSSRPSVRILYLAMGVFDKGGISRYCRYQISALREIVGESNIRVLSLSAPGANDFEEPFRVDYHAQGTDRKSDLVILWAAVRYAVATHFDLIWSSHLHLMPHALALKAFATRARVLINVYGRELWGKNQWLHKRTVPHADIVVSDCHFSSDFVISNYKVQAKKMRVVWDCVEIQRFHPQPRNRELLRRFGIPTGEQFRYLLTVGRIAKVSRYKGYERMLDTLISMKENPTIVGVFGGDGDDRERLQRRAFEAGLADRVFFLGSVPESLLPDVYNACDVFSLVSERGPYRGEGIPLTPLEAAACGKPILVGNEDGSREAVEDGVNGWALASVDAEGYRRRLLDLLLDDQLRSKMGRAARARIVAQFSYEDFLNKTATIVREILSESG